MTEVPYATLPFFLAGALGRQYFWHLKVKQLFSQADKTRRLYAWIVTVAAVVLPAAYLYLHYVEKDPVTGRHGLYLFDDAFLRELGDLEEKMFLTHYEQSKSVLDNKHRIHRKVVRLTEDLLDANTDVPAIRDQKWKVVVVDHNDVS